MSAIHDLISQVTDPRLRDRLAAEWAKASKDKKFGLVFEDHLPELLPLHKAKPRRGDLVCRRDGSIKDVWQVQKIKDGFALCIKPGNEADEAPDGLGGAPSIGANGGVGNGVISSASDVEKPKRGMSMATRCASGAIFLSSRAPTRTRICERTTSKPPWNI